MSRERELLEDFVEAVNQFPLGIIPYGFGELRKRAYAILAQPEAEPHPDRCPECLSPTGLLCSGEYCTGTWHRKKPAPQQESPNQTMTETTAPTAASGPTPETDEPLCSHCRFPLRDYESGWRHYGSHVAHAEWYCTQRMNTEIDALRAENERLRKELDEARKPSPPRRMHSCDDPLCAVCGYPYG